MRGCVAAIAHVGLWHLASFRCGAKVQTLLEVKRTYRDRWRRINPTRLTQSGHRSDRNPAVQHVLPDRGVLSFRSKAREVLGSETA